MKANSRNALVIGASRGLGLALVRELLSRGWTVTATLRHDEKSELPFLADAWPEQLMIEQLDVVEDSEIDALSARLSGARADLLFVNAGIIHDKKETAETISRDEFTRLMQINALGPARVAERLMDHVAPNGTVAATTSELASIVDTVQTRGGGDRLDLIDDTWNAFIDLYCRVWAAEIGLHPAGCDKEKASRFTSMAYGHAAHQHVERCLACPVAVP